METCSFAHTLNEAASTKASDVDVVVAVGGDGTANAVANGLYRLPASSRPPMGLIPCGRGNDFATKLGIGNLENACAILLQGNRRPVDVGSTESGIFLGVAGAGFDSQVARRAQRGVPLLTGSAAIPVCVADGDECDRPLVSARIVSDSSRDGPECPESGKDRVEVGGGMRIAPHARVDDGLLDLVLVKEISRATLLRMLPSVFSGSHVAHPQVFYVKTKSASIETDEPAELFADGEFMQAVPARIDIAPAALEVVAPRSREGHDV